MNSFLPLFHDGRFLVYDKESAECLKGGMLHENDKQENEGRIRKETLEIRMEIFI
jgi:hypothetical protein